MYFALFLATILITRVWLWFTKISSPTIRGFRMHHYMYGIVLILTAWLLKNPAVYAVGLALLVDEAPVLMKKGWQWHEYDSTYCRVGVLVFTVVIYATRERIFAFV